MTRSRDRAAALLPLLLAPLLLTACSSTGSSTGAVASAHARASAIASAAPPGSAGPVATGPVTTGAQLCALVSVAQAAAVLHSTPPVADQDADTFIDGEPICGFGSADGKFVVNVLWGAAEFDPYHPPKATLGSDPTSAVPGLGHPAAANRDEVDVQIGDHTLVVESFGTTDASHDQVIALAKLFIPKL